ncbi:hypothetical protein B296_00032572 [Ensete ventricosum]|uniref:Uncharacterized protein n=1 Tax=Ensete ventricosum TaxID=4639 RepID=A0A427AD72_ENSVE|nr:hypothetical protein B296_00032572 [Ensete ventricosum]
MAFSSISNRSQPQPCSRDPLPLLDSTLSHLSVAPTALLAGAILLPSLVHHHRHPYLLPASALPLQSQKQNSRNYSPISSSLSNDSTSLTMACLICSSFPDLLLSCWTRTNTISTSYFPGGRNLLSPLVVATSSWVVFTSDHSSLVTLCLFFRKKLLLQPCLCSSPRGLSLLSFVYRLLDLSSAHLTGTECVLLLLPNLQDGHQFLALYNQNRNILSDFTPLSALLLEV